MFPQIDTIYPHSEVKLPGQHVIVPLLGKIRASFTVAGPLSLAGKSQSSVKVYMRVVKEVLSEESRPHLSAKKLRFLEDKVKETQGSDDFDENARLLRKGLECIYDNLIDHYCGLNGVTFNPSHEKITRALELCGPLARSRRYADAVRICRKVADDLLSDTSLSQTALKRLQDAVDFSLDCKDQSEANFKLRKSLDYVYDEIRLPEIYSELPLLEKSVGSAEGQKSVLFGMADFGEGLPIGNIVYLTDRVIEGKSSGEFFPNSDGFQLGVFKGSLRLSNDGGFASFRLMPEVDIEFKDLLSDCKGFVLSIRNKSDIELRPKMLLSSEKNVRAFNWQSGFTLPPQGEQCEIFLPLYNFWPTMFGHALAHSGNVRVEYIDSVGLMLSKIEENGTCNEGFRECDFYLGLNYIGVLK